jgi:hypothetical protein
MDSNLKFRSNLEKGRMTMRKTTLILAATIAALLTLSTLSFGQEFTGNMFGTVRDSTGAVVAGATVKVTDNATNVVVRTATTNDDGEFSVPNLLVSTYTVTVEAPNFKKSVQTNVKVDVGQRRAVDVILEAGKIDETVTVQADTVTVETTTPQSSTTINGDQVRELSINNRNFVQLILLAPGVSNDEPDFVPTGTTNQETGAVNIQAISVNGARSSANTYTVDGADITDRGSNLTIQAYPSVDSISEFRVLRSLFPAESGRSGGGQINVVTRGGSSKVHGTLYEFIRNDALNANDYISNSSPGLATTLGRECPDGTVSFSPARSDCKLRRRAFRYNNFGWTLGGPVYFFNFGEHDPGDPMFVQVPKTFFFYSQEFRRDKRAPVFASTQPTAAMKQGVFTVPICLQATGATCNLTLPANTPITTLRPINPIAQQYINFVYNNLGGPNVAANSFSANYPIESNLKFQQDTIRIDHSIGTKTSLFYKFQNDKIPTIDGNAIFSSGSGLPDVSTLDTNSPGKTHTLQATYLARPNVIIQGRFTYGWGAIKTTDIGTLSLERSPITPNLPYPRTKDRIPSVTGNGFTGLVGQGQYDNFSYKENFGGDVTWIKGSHSMKFGGVYSLYRKNENNLAGNNEGIYNAFFVPGTTTANVIPTGGNTTQQSWANFLLGTNVGFTQASFDYTADFRQKTIEFYGQDEWRVGRNITLYYGVRYSYFGSPYDKNGRLTNFVPELWSAAAAPAVTGAGNRVPGTGNYCNGIVVNTNGNATFPNCTPTQSPFGKYIMEVQKNNFAPRVGIAWDPFGKGETAIRTGYGIYHEQILNGMLLSNVGTNQPFQQTCTVANGVDLQNPAAGCVLVATNTANNIRAIDPHFKTPYYQHWTMDVQHQLTKSTVISVGYYGSKGTHLIGGFEMNLIPPGAAIARGATGCATGATYIGGPGVTLGPCQTAGQAFFTAGAEAILDQLRPFRGYRSITMIQPRYNSNYHSMQVSAQHRFSGASQVNLSYTWAKNLTDAQNDRSTSPQNTYDVTTEKARAALDRRHILTVNYVYEFPWMKDQEGFVGMLLGGWQVSGIGTYQSGLPFTPTVAGFDPSGLGLLPPPLTVARPNILCDPNQGGAQTFQQWFNPACFQITPTAGSNFSNTVGNGARGIVLGPSTKRVDITLSKNFRWGERYRLQLRGEAFNVFNWTNFRGLSTGVWNTGTAPVAFGGTCTTGCSIFGSVTTVRDPRNMQLGVKFYF